MIVAVSATVTQQMADKQSLEGMSHLLYISTNSDLSPHLESYHHITAKNCALLLPVSWQLTDTHHMLSVP
jgi:hypothetical protein